MAKQAQNRTVMAHGIRELINVQGATHVTIVLDAPSAEQLADDLLWCERSTERGYGAEVVKGDIRGQG